MRLPIRIVLETTVCAAAFFAGSAAPPAGELALKVLPNSRPPEVWARPYVAPAMLFHQTTGQPPEGFVEGCRVVPMERDHPDHVDRIVVLTCAKGIKLELRNVDFEH